MIDFINCCGEKTELNNAYRQFRVDVKLVCIGFIVATLYFRVTIFATLIKL